MQYYDKNLKNIPVSSIGHTNLFEQFGLVNCVVQFVVLLMVAPIFSPITVLSCITTFISLVGYYLIKIQKYQLGIKLSLSTSFICLSIAHYFTQEFENIHIIMWYMLIIFTSSIFLTKKWVATFLMLCLFNTISIKILSQLNINVFDPAYLLEFKAKKKDFFYYIRLTIPFLATYYLVNHYITDKTKNEAKILSLLNQKDELNNKLISSQLMYRNLVEEADDLIYQIGQNGMVVYANQTTVQKTGYSEKDLLRFTYLDLVPKEYKKDQTKFFVNQSINQLKISYREFPIHTKSGETVWLGQKTSMFFDEKGQRLGSLCIARDITEERAIKEELIDAKEKAIEATKVKAQFLSSMSHEIRTPMNAVIALTHLLLEEDPKEHQKEHLETLQFSAKNLLHLINDILDFSKIEAGKVTFTETSFNLKRVLRTIQHGLGSKAKEKGVQLHLNFGKNTPEMVLGDPLRLTQVLNNLVGNAIKFTHKGEVRVRVSSISQSSDLTNIQFVIEDTGIGIPPDQLDSIFDDFSQVNDTNIRQGTGLGLAISKNILELQGSRIDVSSELNKGSVFKFTLHFKKYKNPLSLGVVQPHTPSSLYPISNNRPLHKTKLLLVEDNVINQKVTINFLKKWGIEVDIAGNGQIAVDAVQSKRYQVILMDLQMPVMDGIEATKAIRKMGGYYATAPIIALTASAITEVKEETNRVGFTDFIAKPFLPTDLHQKISQHISLTEATSRA